MSPTARQMTKQFIPSAESTSSTSPSASEEASSSPSTQLQQQHRRQQQQSAQLKQQKGNALCLSIELDRVVGVPMPKDENARAAIKSRLYDALKSFSSCAHRTRFYHSSLALMQTFAALFLSARVCLFEGNVPISNVFDLEVQWSADEEDVWRFEMPQDSNWNTYGLEHSSSDGPGPVK
jgi:hypothetical protein